MRHGSLSQLCVMISLAFLLPACLLDTSFDASDVVLQDADGPADATPDGLAEDISTTDGSADIADGRPANDIGPDTELDTDLDTGADAARPTYNLCGGLGDLLVDGEVARPGSNCGPFNDGIFICNGREALRCEFATQANECGGPGELPVPLGSACGCAGEIVCAEDGGVRCADTVQRNACGGCDALDGRPGFFCEQDGIQGRYVCETFDSLICLRGAGNACGGDAPLRLVIDGQATEDGEILEGVFPGDACSTDCGAGRYVCDNVDGLRCQPERPCNVCGGTRSLAGAPDTTCGACGQGSWQCDGSDAVSCVGAITPNVCGGCDALDIAPGAFCDDPVGGGVGESFGLALCLDGGVTCSSLSILPGADAGSPVLNNCGGYEVLRVPAGLPDADEPAEPGDSCGACGTGQLVCDGADALRCSVSDAEQLNVCNGCTTITGRPDIPCGTCGTGRLACDGTERLVCNGDLGDESGRNACGGCGSLPGVVGGECGTCLVWACNGTRLECTPTTEGAGCSDLAVCDDLDCAEQNRTCIEGDGSVAAVCAGCINGYVEFVSSSCAPVDCGALAAPDSGLVDFVDTTFGATATYACDERYTLNGDATRTCLATGEWSGSAPRCDSDTLAVACSRDSDCNAGEWCPTGTLPELRRCSPRLFAGEAHEMQFMFVPSGTFEQGTPGAADDERPFTATITRNYWVSRTEVTQGQWTAATEGVNPSYFQNTTCTDTDCNSNENDNEFGPVERISWYAAVAYANWLSAAEGLESCYTLSPVGCADTVEEWATGDATSCTGATFPGIDCPGYRLLTESEWERAARGGTTDTYHWGDVTTPDTVDQYAWYNENSGERSQLVGGKLPNAYGLFDMFGNVREWVWDFYSAAYPDGSAADYSGPPTGSRRSERGGSWSLDSSFLRSAARALNDPTIQSSSTGLRLARTVP